MNLDFPWLPQTLELMFSWNALFGSASWLLFSEDTNDNPGVMSTKPHIKAACKPAIQVMTAALWKNKLGHPQGKAVW